MSLDFLDVEDTLRILGVTEDELAEMVASGRLRAYVDDNRTRFLQGDVEGARIRRSMKIRTARRVRNPNSKGGGADGEVVKATKVPATEIFDPDSLPGESLFGEADGPDLSEAEAEEAIDRILKNTERPAAQASEPRSYRLRKDLKERSKKDLLEDKKSEPARTARKAKKAQPRKMTVHDEESPASNEPPLPAPSDLDSRDESAPAVKTARKDRTKEKEKKAKEPPPSRAEPKESKGAKESKAPRPATKSRPGGLPLRELLPGEEEATESSGAKKVVMALGLLAAFGGIFAYNFLSSGTNPWATQDLKKVFVAEVAAGDIIQTVASQGQIVPNDRAEVKPVIRGQVAAIAVEPGQLVTKGQPIIELSSTQLEHEEQVALTQLERANKSLDELQVKIENAKQELEYQRAQVPKKREDIQRQVKDKTRDVESARRQLTFDQEDLRDKEARLQAEQGLIDQGAGTGQLPQLKTARNAAFQKVENSKASIETAQAVLEATKAQLEDVDTSLHRYEGDLRVLEASMDQVRSQIAESEANHRQAVDKLRDRSIAAPIDGTVQRVEARLGDQVDPSVVLLEIVDLSKVYLEAEIDENEIERIETGQAVAIEIEAFRGEEFSGRVERIASEGRRRTGGSDVSVFPTRILIEQPLARIKSLRPGMSGRADITILTERGVLVVPQAAVVRRRPPGAGSDDEERSYVYLVKSGKEGGHEVVQEEVMTGVLDQIHIQITGGLKGGEKIVVGPYHVLEQLRPKMQVEIEREEK